MREHESMRAELSPGTKRKIDITTVTAHSSSSPAVMQGGVIENATPNNYGHKRLRRELYTFSKGDPAIQHPCEKPFVHCDDGTRMPLLKFNPWQLGLPFVLTSELSKFILYVLFDRECHQAHGISLPEFFVTSDEHHRLDRLVFIAGHGVCPVALGEHLRRSKSESSVPFLQTCSSVPLRHTSNPPTPNVWKYTEVEPMTSLLLWKDQPMIESLSGMIQSVGIMKAFSCHRLVYTCLHDGVTRDDIIFVPDESLYPKLNDMFNDSANTAQLTDFIEKVIDSTSKNQIEKFNKSKATLNEISNHSDRDTTICTKFKQGEGVYGQCVLKFVADLKVMFIFFNQKLDQILMLISNENDGDVMFSNSNFVLTLLKAHAIDVNANTCTKGRQDVGVKLGCDDKTTLEDMKTSVMVWMQASSQRIKQMYTSLTTQPQLAVFRKKLDLCCVSLDLLEAFDFPVFVINESGQRELVNVSGPTGQDLNFVSTHRVDEWTVNDRSNYVNSSTDEIIKAAAFKVEEEGEEGECTSSDEEDDGCVNIDKDDCFMKPLLSEEIKSLGRLKICAIDCEMCTTVSGALEICRVSLISPEVSNDNLVVLDTFVIPDNKIVDYHTEFSGITEEIMRDVRTKRHEVLEAMKYVIGPDTILVGHSLESDLKALGIVHHRVLDTAILYPHQRGIPFRNSLKLLADIMLGMTVQSDEEKGHDSIQDAAVALELSLHYFCNILIDRKDVTISCRSWINRDQFLIPKAPLIDKADSHMYKKAQKFIQNPHQWRPAHERFLIGYRGESYSENFNTLVSESIDKNVGMIPPNVDVSSCFTWIDYDLTGMENEDMDTNLKDFDNACTEIYKKYQYQGNSLLIIITQGDLLPLALKIAKKRKSQWADKAKEGSGDWDGDRDEADLITSAAHVLAGSCFLKHSNG